MSLATAPVVSGGQGERGHLEEFRTDPIALMQRVRDECGDFGIFHLANKKVVMLSGAEANEFFFRAADEDMDPAEAYPFMTPIFGEGVSYDISPERRKEMLHNNALRGEHMKGHAATIENEVHRMIAEWGDHGEIDLLEFFAELTIYTSTACLIGIKFRNQLDSRFAHLYHELERGTDPLCYVDPYLPIESFRRRDEARVQLVELVSGLMAGRLASPPASKEDRDMLDVLVALKDEHGEPRFSASEITGMFISLMFAGTTPVPDAIVDAYRAAEASRRVRRSDRRTRRSLRRWPVGQFSCTAPDSAIGDFLKEVLRLHPPLIILMRCATGEFEVVGHTIHRGDMVAVSPAISNRAPEDFPEPDRFIPQRYVEPRQEDLVNRWTGISFGAGRHRCVGAAFATMQIKAIFSVLLRAYEFQMAQPADTYRNDH